MKDEEQEMNEDDIKELYEKSADHVLTLDMLQRAIEEELNKCSNEQQC